MIMLRRDIISNKEPEFRRHLNYNGEVGVSFCQPDKKPFAVRTYQTSALAQQDILNPDEYEWCAVCKAEFDRVIFSDSPSDFYIHILEKAGMKIAPIDFDYLTPFMKLKDSLSACKRVYRRIWETEFPELRNVPV